MWNSKGGCDGKGAKSTCSAETFNENVNEFET